MKKLIGIMVILFLLGTFKSFAQTSSNKTEEYAIVDVFETGKKKIIRITIGEEPAQEKEWSQEKTEISGDFSPVIAELNKLNLLGFELLNMSTTYTTIGGGTYVTHGTPRFTFMMVKKVK